MFDAKYKLLYFAFLIGLVQISTEESTAAPAKVCTKNGIIYPCPPSPPGSHMPSSPPASPHAPVKYPAVPVIP